MIVCVLVFLKIHRWAWRLFQAQSAAGLRTLRSVSRTLLPSAFSMWQQVLPLLVSIAGSPV